MKILALDTSGLVASVALVSEDKLIAEYTIQDKLTHSQTLMPMMDSIKTLLGLEMETVDYIACAAGPGSFTGLRIGAAAAKGLALGLNVPLIPVPTLDALAYNVFAAEGIICPIMDARRQQVYTAFYAWKDGRLCRLNEERAIGMDVVLEEAAAFGCPVTFVGDGVPVHKKAIQQNPLFRVAPVGFDRQRGACIAALAMEKIAAGETAPGREFIPTYLRKSQAEREREAMEKKAREEESDA